MFTRRHNACLNIYLLTLQYVIFKFYLTFNITVQAFYDDELNKSIKHKLRVVQVYTKQENVTSSNGVPFMFIYIFVSLHQICVLLEDLLIVPINLFKMYLKFQKTITPILNFSQNTSCGFLCVLCGAT